MYYKSHSIIVKEEQIELQIPLRLDGILSYFPTRNITPEDIENIDHVKAIFITPESTSWDPYNDAYEEKEDKFIDHRGEMIYQQQNKRKENSWMTDMFLRSLYQPNNTTNRSIKPWMTTI